MSSTRPARRTGVGATPDTSSLVASARSIVSCPGSVQLSVAGVPDVGAGQPPLAVHDDDGTPVLSCGVDSLLALAALEGRHAVLHLTSGLGRPGSAERGDRVALGGRLVLRDRQSCPCCDEERDEVALLLDDVVVCLADAGDLSGVPTALPTTDYDDPAHRLNRGYLQRCAEHAVQCHEPDLRAAVALRSGSGVSDIGGVRLEGLSTRGLSLHWVDAGGGHTRRIDFDREATTGEELATLLHAGLQLL